MPDINRPVIKPHISANLLKGLDFYGSDEWWSNPEKIAAARRGTNGFRIAFNNNVYGTVLRAQIEEFDNRIIGTQATQQSGSYLTGRKLWRLGGTGWGQITVGPDNLIAVAEHARPNVV